MRPALTFSTRRATSSQCLWHWCSNNTQYLDQLFNHSKRSRRILNTARPSLCLLPFTRLNSTHALKRQEEDTHVQEDLKRKFHPREMNKNLQLEELFDFLTTHTLTHKEIFRSLRTALYNTSQYDYQKAWLIYEKMVEYQVDKCLKENHYGYLLCILKYGPSPARSLEVIENMKRHSLVLPTNYHLSQVLFAMSRNGLGKMACWFMKTIPHPTANHYHSLVVAVRNSQCVDSKLLEETISLMLKGMKKNRVILDKSTLSLVASLLAKDLKINLAVDLIKVRDQVAQAKNQKKKRPLNVYIYTSLIAGCARKGDSKEAKELYAEMKRHGIKPTQATYTALMEAYGRAGDFSSAIRLLTGYHSKHKQLPNSMITSLLINALRHDNLVVAENALKFMSNKNYRLADTDGVLRAAILWFKTRRDVDAARQYFNDLYMNDKRFVNSVMVNHLIKEYGRRGDKPNVLDAVQQRFNLTNPQTTEEKRRTNHYLINALFHCRDVPAALGVFIAMRNEAVPDQVTMAMIIKGLIANNEADLAWRLFKTLQKNGKEPNLHAYTSILQSLADRNFPQKKESNAQLNSIDPKLLKFAGIESSKLDFQHSPVPVTTEALILFRRLTGFYQPNVYIYTTLISCFATKNIYQAINIFEHMCSNQVKPTVVTYTALLQGCAIFRKSDLAIKVFNHMCENQVEPNETTWRYLLKGLVRSHVDKKQIDKIGQVARTAIKRQ